MAEEPKHKKSFWDIFKRKQHTPEKNTNSSPQKGPPPGFQQGPPPPGFQRGPPPGFQRGPPPRFQQGPPPGFQQGPPPPGFQQGPPPPGFQRGPPPGFQRGPPPQQPKVQEEKECPKENMFTITIHLVDSDKKLNMVLCSTQTMIQFIEKVRTVLEIPPSTSKVFYNIQLFDVGGREYEINQQLVSGPVLRGNNNAENLHEGSNVYVKVTTHSTGLINFIVQRYNGSQLYISAHLSDRLSVILRKIGQKIISKGATIDVSLINQQGVAYSLRHNKRSVRLSDTDIRDGTIVRLIEQIV